MTDAKHDGVSTDLAEAVLDIIDILRGRPASRGDGPDNWERIVGIIAERDSLPDSEIKGIQKAIIPESRPHSEANKRRFRR